MLSGGGRPDDSQQLLHPDSNRPAAAAAAACRQRGHAGGELGELGPRIRRQPAEVDQLNGKHGGPRPDSRPLPPPLLLGQPGRGDLPDGPGVQWRPAVADLVPQLAVGRRRVQVLGKLGGHLLRQPAQLPARRGRLAVGETVILLHPPLPLAGVSIETMRECQQNDGLADGYVRVHLHVSALGQEQLEHQLMAVAGLHQRAVGRWRRREARGVGGMVSAPGHSRHSAAASGRRCQGS